MENPDESHSTVYWQKSKYFHRHDNDANHQIEYGNAIYMIQAPTLLYFLLEQSTSQNILTTKSASNANMYMFAILAGFLPTKTLVEG